MNISDLSKALALRAEAVAQHLLPNGKREGGKWVVGSLSGEEGKSLKLDVAGQYAGEWRDFATDEHGDLVDLWRIVRGLNPQETMLEAAAWSGVTLQANPFERREQTFKRPARAPVPVQPSSRAMDYLTGERLITPETIEAYRLGVGKGDEIVFPFFDIAGDLAAAKWRKIDEKSFSQAPGCKPILFGWQAIPDSCRAITICEGELDACSLMEYGYPALSVPLGGGDGKKNGWIEHEFDNLARFDTIYLAMDQDEVGQKATADIAERLGRHRCKVVELPHKDANECLQHGVTAVEIRRRFEAAKTRDPSELKSAGHFREAIYEYINPTKAEIGYLPPWEYAKALRFRPGELTVFSGQTGHGKSEGIGHILVDAVYQGAIACVASMELSPDQFYGRLVFQVAGQGKPTRQTEDAAIDWMDQRIFTFFASSVKAKTDKMLEIFAYARMRYGCDVFVIDNLSVMDVDMDDYNGQREFMVRLLDFVKTHRIHMFLIVHEKKIQGSDETVVGTRNSIKGSGSIADLADNILVWYRNRNKEKMLRELPPGSPDREKYEKQGDAKMVCEKQRHGRGDEPSIKLYWCKRGSRQFHQTEGQRPREYVEVEHQRMTA